MIDFPPSRYLFSLSLFVALIVPACGGGSSETPGDGDDTAGDGDAGDGDGDTADGDTAAFNAPSGQACEASERLGSFRLALAEDYTTFAGSVSDAVIPAGVAVELAQEGTCTLLGPPELFCETPCEAGQTCAGDGACVDTPLKISAGSISVAGAQTPITEEPNGITSDYSNTFDDPYPGFAPGAQISMVAAGAEFPGLQLDGVGVELLVASAESFVVERDVAATLTWTPPSMPSDDVDIEVELTVNAHGSTSGWIVCTFPDTGELSIPANLITSLIDLGLSGFPRVTIARRSVDHQDVQGGCVDFRVSSEVMIPVEIPGLESCSEETDCTDGKTCNAELVCE